MGVFCPVPATQLSITDENLDVSRMSLYKASASFGTYRGTPYWFDTIAAKSPLSESIAFIPFLARREALEPPNRISGHFSESLNAVCSRGHPTFHQSDQQGMETAREDTQASSLLQLTKELQGAHVFFD